MEVSRPLSAGSWQLDPAVVLLNHGSFGACPLPVLERQTELRAHMEAEPVRFLVRQLPSLLDRARAALADMLGAKTENLVFVSNATAGVNAVVRSLRLRPGDELLLTNHGYNACCNAVRYVAQREAATVVVADVPVPIESPEQFGEALLSRVTARTRLAVIDHITSPTAVVLPIADLVQRLQSLGVDVLVDGAHAPGMVPLNLERLGAAYYVGNLHKWLCGPKGSGFLYVRGDRQQGVQPPVISHGYNQPRSDHTRFQDAFDWQGTVDPTPWLCVSAAIEFLAGVLPDGLTGLMERNRQLAIAVRRLLCRRLPLRPICPETMLGSMAAMVFEGEPQEPLTADPLAEPPLPRLGRRLLEECGIEVPVYYWPASPQSILRISAHAYNYLDQYANLAERIDALFRQ